MTKEVAVEISGTQSWNGDGGRPVETSATGEYYQKNGTHYIVYEETVEGCSGTAKNLIRLGEGNLHLTKRGPVAVRMMFEKGRKCRCHYRTPYGSFPVEIDTRAVEFRETEQEIEIVADYLLQADCGEPADCTIRITVRPRQK